MRGRMRIAMDSTKEPRPGHSRSRRCLSSEGRTGGPKGESEPTPPALGSMGKIEESYSPAPASSSAAAPRAESPLLRQTRCAKKRLRSA